MGVGICERLAKDKGVRGDAESEGSPGESPWSEVHESHLRFSFQDEFQDEFAKKTESKISPDGTGVNVPPLRTLRYPFQWGLELTTQVSSFDVETI